MCRKPEDRIKEYSEGLEAASARKIPLDNPYPNESKEHDE
jgi:hypothetical protein